jgi:hypothetical protein
MMLVVNITNCRLSPVACKNRNAAISARVIPPITNIITNGDDEFTYCILSANTSSSSRRQKCKQHDQSATVALEREIGDACIHWRTVGGSDCRTSNDGPSKMFKKLLVALQPLAPIA